MPKCQLQKRRPPSESVREQQSVNLPVMPLTGSFSEQCEKLVTGSSVESSKPQTFHQLIPWFPRQQRHKHCNARMPSASSNSGAECDDGLVADRANCSLRYCVLKDQEPFNCSNKCWQILRQHVKGAGRKKLSNGDERGERFNPVSQCFPCRISRCVSFNLTPWFPVQRSDCPD